MSRHALLRRCLLATVLGVAGNAAATGLQVAPTSLSLAAGQNAGGIWLSNTGAAVLHTQVRVYEWTQNDGGDLLTPSRELAISPPMVQLDVGARQLIRVIRVGAAPTGSEAAYRIIVDELPVDEPARSNADAVPAADMTNKGALKFVLRYSIPVFVLPGGAASLAPQLAGNLSRDAAKPVFDVQNNGNMHAQLGNLAFVDTAGKRTELVPGLLGYVLAGRRMHWPVNATGNAFAQGGTLQSRINGEAGERALAHVDPAR